MMQLLAQNLEWEEIFKWLTKVTKYALVCFPWWGWNEFLVALLNLTSTWFLNLWWDNNSGMDQLKMRGKTYIIFFGRLLSEAIFESRGKLHKCFSSSENDFQHLWDYKPYHKWEGTLFFRRWYKRNMVWYMWTMGGRWT